jgi:hypothetical protein
VNRVAGVAGKIAPVAVNGPAGMDRHRTGLNSSSAQIAIPKAGGRLIAADAQVESRNSVEPDCRSAHRVTLR